MGFINTGSPTYDIFCMILCNNNKYNNLCIVTAVYKKYKVFLVYIVLSSIAYAVAFLKLSCDKLKFLSNLLTINIDFVE